MESLVVLVSFILLSTLLLGVLLVLFAYRYRRRSLRLRLAVAAVAILQLVAQSVLFATAPAGTRVFFAVPVVAALGILMFPRQR